MHLRQPAVASQFTQKPERQGPPVLLLTVVGVDWVETNEGSRATNEKIVVRSKEGMSWSSLFKFFYLRMD